MEKPIIIGIAGGTGSGKTTLVKKLNDVLGDEVVALTHDYYYKAYDHLELKDRKRLNFDHPNLFDTDMLINDLTALKDGKSIERPIYSFAEYTRMKETVRVDPKKVIIIEGILIFLRTKS